MDANGQNFCLLSASSDWNLLGEPGGLEYDESRSSLRLAHQRRELRFTDNLTLAEERLLITPQTRDAYGNRARVDEISKRIIASSDYSGETILFDPEDDSVEISDIVMGFDDVLYIAIDGRIIMHDRRERWLQQNIEVPTLSDFTPWRMAADAEGGVWVLDRENKKIARLSGMPLHKLSHRSTVSTHPRHCVENTNPPRLMLLEKLQWPDNEQPVAISCNRVSEVAVLCWVDDEDACLRRISRSLELTDAMQLAGSVHPYGMQWLNRSRIALLIAGIEREAPVYRIDKKQNANWPTGELYPLKNDFDHGPFLHGLEWPPHYPTVNGSRGLHRLSFPFYSREGQATNDLLHAPLDSGDTNHIWHRMYLEAVIPKGCGIRVWLAATDKVMPFTDILPEHWYEHRFGKIFQQPTRADIPVAVWESVPSELPHHAGLLPCAIDKDSCGLFSVLIQRSSRRVRSLQGRYLHIHVELSGQGRDTAEIFALRAYGSRFSYIDEYLPQFYRESTFKPEADEVGAATRADFYTRFVSNFEGVLSNIEDRIAQAHLLTDPGMVPAESLPWLGSWIGHEVNQSLPETVQRQFLQSVPDLYRWHGSLRGLKLALEIATEGAVSGGEIVVLEDFRLRRTFASIIGADLSDADDPLTTGASISGNSFVGDTLFVGDENNKEFLALFSADLEVDTSEQNAIEHLFERLAHRITILVHEEVEAQDLGLIRRITELETPAHVEYRVLSASNRFLVGMAALVGVDTYLANKISPRSARIGKTTLGQYDFVNGPGALDSRLQGLGAGMPDTENLKPLAFAADATREFGDDITLDGSQSRAFGGRSLTKYNWEYKGKGE
ncbi:MAG: phage tail protein [bacterium]|nr:phage tail protein [bacterium]